MEEIANQAVEQTPTVEAPIPTPEPTTIADHAKQFGPDAVAPGPDDDEGPEFVTPAEPRDDKGRFRSRAKSQRAGADDVPRIRELTKRLRTLEQEREQERQQWQAERSKQPVAPYVPPAPKLEFNEPEPQLEQFADKDDPYGEWMLARGRYERKRERFEEQSQQATQQHQSLTQQERAYWDNQVVSHKQRLMAVAQADQSAYQALVAANQRHRLPELLDKAIVSLDKDSVAAALFLANHPHVADRLTLLTDQKPVNNFTVETIQRLLRHEMSAVSSGAVAPSQPAYSAPRPPTPLRTAPMRASDELPAVGSSIAEHAKIFHSKSRR